jgi:hypothetical protein
MVLAPNAYTPLKVRVGPTTDDLVAIISQDKQFPFMLAMDRADASIYPIRLFPSSDGKELSFHNTVPIKLQSSPFKMAALDDGDQIFVIYTLPSESRIEIRALDHETMELKTSVPARSIALGHKPSHVVIDDQMKKAIISDEGENNIHVLSLGNIKDVLTTSASPQIEHIDVGMKTDKLYLSRRDFGQNERLYAMSFGASGNAIKLMDMDDGAVKGEISLKEPPLAGYFPDAGSDTCCGGIRSWFSIGSILGNLFYIAIESSGSDLVLKEMTEVDLKSNTNLALSRLYIKKIVGGAILEDPGLKLEKICPKNRQTFYISGYGSSRPYLEGEVVEVEAHGYSCEGENTATRFGIKQK